MTQWGLDTLFNPAKRHMDEEKRRLQSTREEIGDNSGGKRIDLESGKVRIRPSDEADGDEISETDDTDSAAKGDEDAKVRPAKEAVVKPGRSADGKRSRAKASRGEPSPAAIRAAQRRGRQAR
jgi:Family of unknown function (DUF6191)